MTQFTEDPEALEFVAGQDWLRNQHEEEKGMPYSGYPPPLRPCISWGESGDVVSRSAIGLASLFACGGRSAFCTTKSKSRQ